MRASIADFRLGDAELEDHFDEVANYTEVILTVTSSAKPV